MSIEFTELAYKDFLYWEKQHHRFVERIKTLCRAIQENPFSGIGKPEALLYDLQGCWSRRIDRTHRLVYQVEGDRVIILSCRYHY